MVHDAAFLIKHPTQIKHRRLLLNELGVPDDVVQTACTHLCQILAYFFCQEGEIVHEMLGTTQEMLTQTWVLGCHTHRTCVLITFAHHHAPQHDESCGAEAEFVGTEQCHQNHVASRLDLSIYLQTHL